MVHSCLNGTTFAGACLLTPLSREMGCSLLEMMKSCSFLSCSDTCAGLCWVSQGARVGDSKMVPSSTSLSSRG